MKKYKTKIGALVHIVFQSATGSYEHSIDLYDFKDATRPEDWRQSATDDFFASEGAAEFFDEHVEKAHQNAKLFCLEKLSRAGFKSIMSIFNILVTYNHSIINIGTIYSSDGRFSVSSSITLTAPKQ